MHRHVNPFLSRLVHSYLNRHEVICYCFFQLFSPNSFETFIRFILRKKPKQLLQVLNRHAMCIIWVNLAIKSNKGAWIWQNQHFYRMPFDNCLYVILTMNWNLNTKKDLWQCVVSNHMFKLTSFLCNPCLWPVLRLDYTAKQYKGHKNPQNFLLSRTFNTYCIFAYSLPKLLNFLLFQRGVNLFFLHLIQTFNKPPQIPEVWINVCHWEDKLGGLCLSTYLIRRI